MRYSNANSSNDWANHTWKELPFRGLSWCWIPVSVLLCHYLFKVLLCFYLWHILKAEFKGSGLYFAFVFSLWYLFRPSSGEVTQLKCITSHIFLTSINSHLENLSSALTYLLVYINTAYCFKDISSAAQ